eukprot:TRINITY_DN50548_c0_g4_i3.p1 TRINITY_DN50548_c0_g4~~TRINITY_DN50548_c0_g4_i3.p1  ORF type:complete len:817 (-),score=203.09 TRINITY_DN50548_c0_g4_i3:38-2488(-)
MERLMLERAVRGRHLLVDTALNALLTAEAFEAPQLLIQYDEEVETSALGEERADSVSSVAESLTLPSESTAPVPILDEDLGDDSLNEALNILESLMSDSMSAKDAVQQEVFTTISSKLAATREGLSRNRTASLWLQYMDMIDILRMSIKAERIGDFDLHLASVRSMLPFLAASGHIHYTKSAWLYLQQMLELKDTHPDVHHFFAKGHHVIRRSDRFWGGLSTDLIIEQVLMRSMKSNGGLTRGTGMGEGERLVWLLCMPACAEMNAAMQSVTDTAFTTSEQHIQHQDFSKSRQERDHKDINLVLKYLQDRNPFSDDGVVLKSIASGRTADTNVNVDQSKRVGDNVLKSMTGKNALDITLKKKDQAVTMAQKTKSKASGDLVCVDSTLLFQRLVKVAEFTPDILEDAFAFELSNVPTSLFDSNGLPRQANKAALAHHIWSATKQLGVQLPEDVVFVIDGGSLLHRLSWPRGTRYNQLVQMYISFISRNYNRGIVVFDGYSSGPSTKDVAHLRRNGGVTGPFIAFAGDMVLTESKERFLANPANKQRFIHLLSQALVKSGFDSLHARGDADCLIVQTTLEKAKETETVLIGEDTDLLILLLHHITEEHHPVYFKSSSAKSASTAKVWDLKLAREGLGAEVCRGILFAHAIGGCDTTSSLFSVGKSLPLKKLLQSASFQKQACVFITPNNNQEQIAAAGETALTVLYGGKDTDSLDKLRHVRYMQKIATSVVSLHPKKLPPTSSAAKFHSMRTYFQVQEWLHLSQDSCHLEPQDWGWEVQNGVMFPVLNDIDVAPEALLHVVRCNCVTECQTASPCTLR